MGSGCIDPHFLGLSTSWNLIDLDSVNPVQVDTIGYGTS
jgi:hypothetical protein